VADAAPDWLSTIRLHEDLEGRAPFLPCTAFRCPGNPGILRYRFQAIRQSFSKDGSLALNRSILAARLVPVLLGRAERDCF
jgi:hypothetical protein